MFGIKFSKKLSSGVLLSSLISVMQSSVGFSVESNVKEENKGAVEINVEKDDVKAENTKIRRVLKVVKEDKNIILPVAGAVLLVPPALYGAKKVYDSRYKEPLNVIVSSGEKSDSVNEPGKSVVEDEILQNDLGKEDISNENLNLPGKDPASEDPLRNGLPKDSSLPNKSDGQKLKEQNVIGNEPKSSKGNFLPNVTSKDLVEENLNLPGEKNESNKEIDLPEKTKVNNENTNSPGDEEKSAKVRIAQIAKIVLLIIAIILCVGVVLPILLITFADLIKGYNGNLIDTFKNAVSKYGERVVSIFSTKTEGEN